MQRLWGPEYLGIYAYGELGEAGQGTAAEPAEEEGLKAVPRAGGTPVSGQQGG